VPAIRLTSSERAERASARRWALLVLPALALSAVVFAYPVIRLLVRSFTDFPSEADSGFANYTWFLGNSTQLAVLGRTFLTAAIVTAVCLAVGYPYAYLITRVSPRWRALLFGVVLLSLYESVIVRNYAWRILLRRDGLVDDALTWIGLGHVELLGTLKAVVIGMAHIMLPFMILPLYASMRQIDQRLMLAAQGLGAPPRKAFTRVYLPLSLPGIVGGCLLVFVISLGFYITPAILGSTSNSLISQAIEGQITQLLYWGRAGAMSVVLLAVTLLVVGVAALLTRRRLAAVTA
jgi:putative spermidine/putrescine transport system permease protein